VQQDGAEFALQLLDGSTQRRLSHVQPDGSAADMAFLGNGYEVTQRA